MSVVLEGAARFPSPAKQERTGAKRQVRARHAEDRKRPGRLERPHPALRATFAWREKGYATAGLGVRESFE